MNESATSKCASARHRGKETSYVADLHLRLAPTPFEDSVRATQLLYYSHVTGRHSLAVPQPTESMRPACKLGGNRKHYCCLLLKSIRQTLNWIPAKMSAEERLSKLGIELPPAPKPMGLYKPIVVVGNVAYLSGHGPLKSDGTLIVGRVGDDMTLEQGQVAARQTALAMLATLRFALGTLDRVTRVVKLLGLVRCTDKFDQQPQVINGCSQMFADIFGPDLGIGARSALGTNALPGGIATEIEGIFEIQ